MKRQSLRRRIVLAIVTTAAVTSRLFGLVTFIFAYWLEDRVFTDELAREITRQQAVWQERRSLTPPRLAYVRVFRAGEALPEDLAPQLRAEPERREFFGGEGRHYHVARFSLEAGGGQAIAVAETSRYLLVRPVRDSFILFLAALTLGVALIAGLIGWALADRALSPLRRLAGDLAGSDRNVPRIDAQSYPTNEIGVLAAVLSDAFDRIRGFVVRERHFTRDASHELRTPLAVIGGAAELLALDPDLPQTALPALRRIATASSDMAQALDLLLALAREDNAPPRTPTALLPLVEKAVASAVVRFPDHSIRLVVDVAPTAEAPVAATLMQLVLNNLIGNAFQHASSGTLRVAGDNDRLLIADTGPGIGDLGDPFVAFGKRPQSGGSGLGLAIVKRLCDAACIDLSWSAAEVGSGVEFLLVFQSGVHPPKPSAT